MIRLLIVLVGLLCLTPFVSAGIALFCGVSIAIIFGNPYIDFTRKMTHTLLSVAIIGMGAGMNLETVAGVGVRGIGYTVIGISSTLLLGYLLKRIYKVDSVLTMLISVGTAICGGSAIAAVAPVIKAKHHEISVSLGIIFILNAIALFIFPPLGHLLNLSQHQFGLWSALAIHDTSSVVGATLQYGSEALQTGTTVKLARALWIVPIAFLIGHFFKTEGPKNVKAKKPWFILGFLIMAAIMTWIPSLKPIGEIMNTCAKQLLVLTLFFIGLNLTRENLKMVGVKPLLLGVTLWILAASGTLLALKMNLIH